MSTTVAEMRFTVGLVAAGSQPGNVEKEFSIEKGRFLADGEQRPQGHIGFRILHQKYGDKRIVWDNRSLDQIDEAKELFDKFVKEGLVPYRVNIKGKKTTEPMTKFDPAAEEIVFAPIQMLTGG
jgi:hypothetical protein